MYHSPEVGQEMIKCLRAFALIHPILFSYVNPPILSVTRLSSYVKRRKTEFDSGKYG